MNNKLILILFLFVFCSFLHSYTIEETISQIEALEKEIAQNEKIVEQKIEELKKNDPLFAEKTPFESETEYFKRCIKITQKTNELKELYLNEIISKINKFKNCLFETDNITITLDLQKYDANTETWSISVKHLDYQKEHFDVTINITKQDASDLYKNWDKVKKTGMLAIDIGNKIGFAKLLLENPITSFKLEYEFNQMKSLSHGGRINSVAFSPDGKFIATGTSSNYVNVIDLISKKFIWEFKISNTVNSVAYSPDGKLLAASVKYGDYVRIYDVETGKKDKSFKIEKYPSYSTTVAFSPDGKFIATGSTSYKACIYNLTTEKEVILFKQGLPVYSVAFSPDGKFIAIGIGNDDEGYGCAKIYNLETKNEVRSFDHFSTVNSVTFSPDGKFLATGSDNRSNLRIFFSKYYGDELTSFKHRGAINSVAFSPDGKFLAIGSGRYDDGYAKIFNLETRDEVKSFKHGYKVNSVAFSPDGRYIAVGCDDKNAYLYRTLLQTDKEMELEPVSSPPALMADVNFNEPSGNKFLDALEKGSFKLTIKNEGQGPAKGIKVKISPERIANLNYNNTYIDEIAPGKSVTVDIPIEAYIGVNDGAYTFRFEFEEANGFPPDPVEIQFSTKSYLKPEMFIVDVGIEDGNSNSKIESGEMIKLTIRFGNKGIGISSGTYAKFYTGENVFVTDSYPKTVSLGDVEYNDFVDVPLEFFVNDKTIDEIPLYVDITEATGLASIDKLRLPIRKSERARTIRKTIVAGIDKDYGELSFKTDLSIDIEQDIPQTSKTNENALAIIFGIEIYKNVSSVTYATRDANFVKEYLNKTIGIKESNIYFRTNEDVGKAEFDKVFSKGGWLDKRVKEGETEIYFYFAGHGAPDIKQNKAYLIPYDGDPNYASQTGYEMDRIYSNLADLKAKTVTVFLDACFSGANRESEMLLADARPIFIEVEGPVAHGITVFSATSSKEISSAWPEKKHGLFSYFLMKGMQGEADANNDNKLTIKELGDYIQQNVSETAGFLDREQTPQMISNDENRILINY